MVTLDPILILLSNMLETLLEDTVVGDPKDIEKVVVDTSTSAS
jgi:hypothetical protein